MAPHDPLRVFRPIALALGLLSPGPVTAAAPDVFAWPEPTPQTRPWTRWWWLGDAVDQPNLRRQLAAFREAGLGGVEVCPVYGAKGYESKFLPYLSAGWLDALSFARGESASLGLGFDLTTGTGWPMGGPWIGADSTSAAVVLKRYRSDGGKRVNWEVRIPALEALVGVDEHGRWVDLSSRVSGGRLAWDAPPGEWRLYAVGSRPVLQQVKRGAPGDEGNVVDPFSTEALDTYLKPIDEAFKHYAGAPPRAQFQDSYEFFGANWTPRFLREFSRRRGYDLRSRLPAFFGEGDAETAARVRCDYRQTIAELQQAFVAHWTAWSHAHGSLAREQAHGSPTNLEDVYATADIPETEGSFAGPDNDDRQMPMLRFASSAAHVTGRTLASSETFSWLGEHFRVPLSQLKPAADFFFLAGINHLFLHGIPYSPGDAPWPGWEFYASVNFGPGGGLWHDFPAFTGYVTRCQSELQSGRPDNDLLLYFPVYDFWQTSGAAETQAASALPAHGEADGLIRPFTTPGKWMLGTAFHDCAMTLWRGGFSYDEVTDRFLAAAAAAAGGPGVLLGGNSYRVVLVPPTRLLPVESLRQLLALARNGATVAFQKSLPTDVPGLNDLAERRDAFRKSIAEIALRDIPGTNLRRASVGGGQILVGADLPALLAQAGVARESMADLGLRCIRRSRPDCTSYFIANRGAHAVNDWVTLETAATSAVILDPLSADRAGVAASRPGSAGGIQVYLQMQPGESRIIRLFSSQKTEGPAWPYASDAAGAPRVLNADWHVHFTEGGPVLPRDFRTRTLGSWAARPDPEAKRFAGTALYTLDFDFPPSGTGQWRLDLGRVCESARVRLNGHAVATLWCPPFSALVGQFLRAGSNHLEIEVTNLAANRIADLDRRSVPWKRFYDINVVNLDYRPFDASGWSEVDSGLLGPVTLRAQVGLQALAAVTNPRSSALP